MNEVISFLKSKLSNDDKVIVACSGGSDSMALLHLMLDNFPNHNIICAHVNHKVRKQSDKEYEYLKSFCEETNVIFEGMEISTKIKHNFESEARKIRYTFFDCLYNKYQAKFIITAHHADDLMETILMRLTRGSNLSGYAGIKFEEGKFLRPFISITKQEILEYVKTNNIKYYEDITNSQESHTRNKYRHKVLPFLKKENKDVHKKYLKFSKTLLEYDNFLEKYINDKELIVNNKVSTEKLIKEEYIVQKKVLELLVKEIQKNNFLEVSDKNVENMLNIINSSKSNSIVNLSNGYIGKKSYNTFEIYKQVINNDFNVVFNDRYEDDNWVILNVDNSCEKSNFVIRLNSEDIKLPLIIRNRLNGDVIKLKNLGSKKVKDIFIDSKVDKDERNSYPLVVDSDGNILWIPGLKKSKFDKEKDEKYDIILSSERK
ncbi:MAG: tRNA lysidine(34) synthetase TilS [Bacilli bacterium]|nr:tRNA lysidine(34) synthetase TilS [Bacilli bacterium]